LDKYDGVYTGGMLRDWIRRCVPAMMLGFVNVDVPGLQRPNEAWGFWLRAAEFETNSRKH
jgi:hypothetical protein